MNFFDAQDRARKRTRILVVLFSFTFTLMTLVLSLAVKFSIYLFVIFEATKNSKVDPESFRSWFSWEIFVVISIVIAGIIAIQTYRGFNLLFDGGSAVLEKIGLRVLSVNSEDQREVLGTQIVAEMSLAAGCPLPRLFVVEEQGINSFSAGWEPSDAVIAVTRGALKHLTREELQALFAHEFSHILNGDMRLNFLMSGLLEGLFFFFQTSGRLLEAVGDGMGNHHYPRSNTSGRGAGYIALAYLGVLIVMLVGGTGYLLGRWIQAVMTRQQSFESDAAAVQFSRDPGSVISLLEKMGKDYLNAYILTSRLEQFSHAFIGAAGKRNFLSAHPALYKRIKAIDPQHVVQLKALELVEETPHLDHVTSQKQPEPKQVFMWAALGLGISDALTPGNGPPSEAIFDEENWQQPMPQHQEWTHNPQAAQATVFALICSGNSQEQDSRLKQLKPRIDRVIFDQMMARLPDIQAMDMRYRVPLLELCVAGLRSMPKPQYEAFKTVVLVLFNTDFKLDHDEFVIQRMILSRLDKQYGLTPLRQHALRVLGDASAEFAMVLSLIAHSEHKDKEAQAAFQAGISAIGATSLKMIDRSSLNLKQVHHALNTLNELRPNLKKRLLTASAATIAMDKKVTLKGFELLRVLAASLDVPLPSFSSETA